MCLLIWTVFSGERLFFFFKLKDKKVPAIWYDPIKLYPKCLQYDNLDLSQNDIQ